MSRKRKGGLLRGIKDVILGKELPSAETIIRRNGVQAAGQIPDQFDDIELDNPIFRGGQAIRTIGEYKDAKEQEWKDSYGYGGGE